MFKEGKKRITFTFGQRIMYRNYSVFKINFNYSDAYLFSYLYKVERI